MTSLGQDAGLVAGVGPRGVLIQEGLPHKGVAQVWIDFSVPAASLAACSRFTLAAGIPYQACAAASAP